MIMHRRHNKILRIKDNGGEWLLEERQIVNHLNGFFREMYQASSTEHVDEVLGFVNKVVTQEMNDILLADISLDEIKEAVFSLSPQKAPGPDGFSGSFYKTYWDIVKSLLVEAITDSFQAQTIFGKFNHTFIVLIPKVEAPEHAFKFRPIALCNFAYKILMKIISNRLKPMMPNLISENQSAFVEGRQIQDNTVIAHECFHHLKLLRSKGDEELALKLDMNKAYDRVEWSFLQQVLVKMGFHSTWVPLVMSCVTTVSMAMLVNGSPGKTFKPTRRLRQGDPLSPFLFLFVNNVLSCMIRKACSENLLNAIRASWNISSILLLLPQEYINAIMATSFGTAANDDSLIWKESNTVVRNEKGLLVAGSSKLDVVPSAIVAETKAIDLGLCLASSLSLSSFSLESDSLSLVSAFQNPLSLVDWSASTLVSRIKRKTSSFKRIYWS
ncbi:hypothetical protein ACLB2K_012220 [Fragaria x ananassa]